MLYLQDTDASNGALMLIPKNHRMGIVKFADKGSLVPGEEVDRAAVLITYNSNSVDNIPRKVESPRPEFLAGRNYEPIEATETSIFTQAGA